MKFMAPAIVITSLLVLAGCDQAEKSAQQLMGKAAETAKQAIDDTQGCRSGHQRRHRRPDQQERAAS